MKKIFLASLLLPFVLISCDEDFNEGIAGPRTSEPDPVQTTSFENGSVTGVSAITLADVTAETVKVCDVKVPTSTEEGATLNAIKLFVADGSVFDLNENGEIKTSELTNLIESNFGRRPVERSIKAMVK